MEPLQSAELASKILNMKSCQRQPDYSTCQRVVGQAQGTEPSDVGWPTPEHLQGEAENELTASPCGQLPLKIRAPRRIGHVPAESSHHVSAPIILLARQKRRSPPQLVDCNS